MNALRLGRNVWSGAAVAIVAAALVALFSVLSGPYSATDAKIQYTLLAALLGAAAFFSALRLVEGTVRSSGSSPP